ncbi:MAG: ApeI family dehydratase [Methylomonas sp.]
MSHSIQQDQPPVLFPDVLGNKPAVDGVILTLRIPETLAYFDGHFDEVAIVPGVVQIQWAVHYARQYLGLKQSFSHMESVKFKELLMPGQHLELGLRYLKQARKLEFWYRSASCEYSSGRIYFHDDSV